MYVKCLRLLTSPTCPGKSIKAGLEQGFNYTHFPSPPPPFFPSKSLAFDYRDQWSQPDIAVHINDFIQAPPPKTQRAFKKLEVPLLLWAVCVHQALLCSFLSYPREATFLKITCKSQKLLRANSSRQINNPPWEEISIICWTSDKSCWVLRCFWPTLLSDKAVVNKNMGPFTYWGSIKHSKKFWEGITSLLCVFFIYFFFPLTARLH